MEFGYCGSEAGKVGEVLVLTPLKGEGGRGIKAADGGGDAVFKV